MTCLYFFPLVRYPETSPRMSNIDASHYIYVHLVTFFLHHSYPAVLQFFVKFGAS